MNTNTATKAATKAISTGARITTNAATNTITHEQLYRLAREGDEQALYALCYDYRPLFCSESRMYLNRMETIDAEDFVQEASSGSLPPNWCSRWSRYWPR